jgi:hypothetical protein
MIGWPPQSAFLTQREWLVLYLTVIAAAGAALLAHNVFVAFAVAAPCFLFGVYRSLPRQRATRRAGLVGFVEQLPAVSEAERERKLAAISAELGDGRPAQGWLRELRGRLVDEAAKAAR